MNEFAIAEVLPGKLNAMVKNLMRQMDVADANEAVRRINSGEWTVSRVVRSWREEDGVITFSVTSDGTTGPQWIERLEKKGNRLNGHTKSVLGSEDFKPTKGVTTQIAVLKGELFKDDDRITSTIRAEADRRKWQKPNAEVACLIREMFSDKEIEAMGLWWIVVMHEPIENSDGSLCLLGADRRGREQWLYAYHGNPDDRWSDRNGFAFSVPQVSPQV